MTLRAASLGLFGLFGLVTFGGCIASSPDASTDDTSKQGAELSGSSIASIANANVGHSACGANSEGGRGYDSSCTGNGGEPEYWCADFARWVWGAAGADTSGLTAAAGSFYVYGQEHGTLSNTPHVGDAVVFDYQGNGYADHVAIVTVVNGDGTIESMSGDWAGQSGSEAHFSSTSHVVRNAPAYPGRVGTSPGIIGMTISGFISPSNGGSSGPVACIAAGVAGTCIDASTCASQGKHSTAGLCPGAADIQCCTASASPPPPPPPSGSPDACNKGGGYCTETLQCDNGHWIIRKDDPNACTTVENVEEPCAEGNGYCTATLQCDNGHWVPRSSDLDACTSGPG